VIVKPYSWNERVLSATIQPPHGHVEISTTHVPPGSSNGRIKIERFERLRLGLATGMERLGALSQELLRDSFKVVEQRELARWIVLLEPQSPSRRHHAATSSPSRDSASYSNSKPE
jgi:hypothetical protein